ncbi:MAG: type-F conjugative transfer system pilin assembly protein TraF [Alphaproteobacteria bacterium]|nr:type-F conjugative transfer system pilin assembly protein TraF [Alphaproteobacteria bacterium]
MKAVFSAQYPVFRGFVERFKSLKLLPVPLKLVVFLLFFFLNTGHCALSTAFFERRAEGWHWYQSLSDNKVEEKKQKPDPALLPQTPTEKIENQRKTLETKLHAAIVEPTRENLMTYIIAQKGLMDQSQRFSESWQRVVMTTPALDETLAHPVEQSARHVYYDEQAKGFSKHMKGFSQEYGLFFFFRQNCAYCHNFAPIVKRFSQKYGWSVLPISLDGGSLPEFPNARSDNGMAARLQITHVPALIALHPKTGKLLPLAYGMISESEIERRIEMLTKLSDKISHGGQK